MEFYSATVAMAPFIKLLLSGFFRCICGLKIRNQVARDCKSHAADNHIHVLWHIRDNHKRSKVQQSLLKYTAQQIRFDLKKNHPEVLEKFKVNACDKEYQFWERNPHTTDIWNESVLLQKLEYIHQNPVRAGKCTEAKDYYYSSAAFYEGLPDFFGFISPHEK